MPRTSIREQASGVVLCLAASTMAFWLAKQSWNTRIQLSSLTIAILTGILVTHLRSERWLSEMSSGIRFSQQRLLRWGIVLYGVRLTVRDVVRVGPAAMLIDVAVITTILSIGWWLGTRLFKLDSDTALLISSGSGICGAAAVLATDRVIESDAHKVSMAVATVVLFGTAGMFLYPALDPILGFTQHQFGVFAGSTIHEVAQVVAAARTVGPAAADVAVITKMMRVLLLAPALLVVGYLRRGRRTDGQKSISVPWFVVGFSAVVILQSLVHLTPFARSVLLDLDTILLGSAMFALGLGTRWQHFTKAGPGPLMLGAVLFVILFAGGAALSFVFVRG